MRIILLILLIASLSSCDSVVLPPSDTVSIEKPVQEDINDHDIVYVKDEYDSDDYIIYNIADSVGKIEPDQSSMIVSVEDKAFFLEYHDSLEKTYSGRVYYLHTYSDGDNIYYDTSLDEYDYSWIVPFDKYALDQDIAGTVFINNKDLKYDIDIYDVLNGLDDDKYIYCEALIYDHLHLPEPLMVGDYLSNGVMVVKYDDSYLKKVLDGNIEPYFEDVYVDAYIDPEFIRPYRYYFVDDLMSYHEVILIPYNDSTIIHFEIDIRQWFDRRVGCDSVDALKFPYMCNNEQHHSMTLCLDYISDVDIKKLSVYQ